MKSKNAGGRGSRCGSLGNKLKRASLLIGACSGLWTVAASAQESITHVVFGYTGSNQTFTVPANVNQVMLTMWGAGGGGGAGTGGAGGYSGGGGGGGGGGDRGGRAVIPRG
ncbi:MAG TPA: hypothetical protein PKU89_08695 [Kiritimatiellia bacterium]|nr:hypothetical protein [Kiritimatiellia bacterium]